MNNFSDVEKFLPFSLCDFLSCLPEEIRENTYEIRLRANKPLVIYGKYGLIFLKSNMTYSFVDSDGAYCVSEEELKETVCAICKYSVYSHQNDIINGFLTFGKGNRAGFAGKAVVENGKVTMINDISSLNIRVSGVNPGLPEEINYIIDDFSGILLAGPPCSGKTTILKSIAETLSSQYRHGFMKTVVIDERYEMQDINALNCDILSGYPKHYGIEHAVRTLSPEIIICDEITSCEEIEKMAQSMYCGVRFIASMHLASSDDLRSSPLFRKLIKLKIFNYVVLLKGVWQAGQVDRILNAEDFYYDCILCDDNTDNFGYCCLSDYKY